MIEFISHNYFQGKIGPDWKRVGVPSTVIAPEGGSIQSFQIQHFSQQIEKSQIPPFYIDDIRLLSAPKTFESMDTQAKKDPNKEIVDTKFLVGVILGGIFFLVGILVAILGLIFYQKRKKTFNSTNQNNHQAPELRRSDLDQPSTGRQKPYMSISIQPTPNTEISERKWVRFD